jgi:serine/threonine-protein kinase HipA
MLPVIAQHCTFPVIENIRVFQVILFSFLTGNEDMHLKNYSLITRGVKTELTPAYDLLNYTIAIRNPQEESALPVRGKKSNLTKDDLINYLGRDRLKLNEKVISKVLTTFIEKRPQLFNLIQNSFLNDEIKHRFLELINERYKRLELNK